MPPARRPVPTEVQIAHATFAIEPNADECSAAGSDGHFLASARRIVYNPTVSPDRRREVLLHEAVHGCVETCGREDLFKDEDSEEAVVHAITGPLLTLIRNNPEFIRFLQST